MAYLNAKSFVFDGKSLDQFHAVMCWFDGDNQDVLDTGLTVELQRGEQNAVRTDPNLYGVVYADTLKFEFGIMPGCGKETFTFEESRAINNWLRGSNGYKELHFKDDIPEHINYYVMCTELQDVVYNGRNGKKIVFTANSPFGYTPLIENKFESETGETAQYDIYNLSDNGTYYPVVKMNLHDEAVGITIKNISDNEKSTYIDFAGLDYMKTLILDSANCKITDENGKIIPIYKIGWDNMDNIYWPRLVKGWNTFEITGASLLLFECKFPRKVGVV